MKYFKAIMINVIFAAFFIFRDFIPPFLWQGGYFVIFLLTVLAFVIMLLTLIGMAVNDDLFDASKAKYIEKRRPDWYYRLDAVYDLVMLFILGGLGLYWYATLYLLTNVVAYIIRETLKD